MKTGIRSTRSDLQSVIALAFAAALAGCGDGDGGGGHPTVAASMSAQRSMLAACDVHIDQRYKVTILDSLGGRYSVAQAINNRGQVVGASRVDPYSTVSHATIWNGTAATDLGAKEEYSEAYDINDAGQMVGVIYRNDNYYPISWSSAGATDLETMGGGGFATAMNNSGLIVGTSEVARNTAAFATLWRDGTISDLGTLGGPKRIATAINEAGDIVGYTSIGDSRHMEHAALWRNGTPIDLSGSSPFDSMANAINNRGQIVGWSGTAQGSRAVMWYQGVMTDLGTLGGNYSAAKSINNAGQIVGVSDGTDNVRRPTLWYGATAVDLRTRVDGSGAGVTLSNPADINDRGQIALLATLPDWSTRAAVLTPIGCEQ